MIDSFIRQGDAQQSGLRLGQCRFSQRAGAEQSGIDELREFGQDLLGALDLIRIPNPHLGDEAGSGQTGVANALLPQETAHIVDNHLEALFFNVRALHPQQDVRPALQIEP